MHVVISSYGSSVSRENANFKVICGDQYQTLSPKDVRSITVSKGASITSDAVLLAIEHGIDVIFVNQTGRPEGRIWSINYGSISEIRHKQFQFIYSSAVIPWIKKILASKIKNQIALLEGFKPYDQSPADNFLYSTIRAINDHLFKIEKADGHHLHDIAPSLRGWEGAATKRYFAAVSRLLPEEYQFEKRTAHPALDSFNACLNYGYGILYSKVESSLIKAGIDPYLGIFHRDEYNRPALVYDVIELFRAWIDFVVIRLCMQHAFTDECFSITPQQCTLESFGKRILIQSVNDYLDEIILIEGHERSRATHLDLYAHRLAKEFLSAPD